jgi:DNA-binding NarL/FixJ family response regulator
VTVVVEQGKARPSAGAPRRTALVAVSSRAARDSAVRILRGVGATDVLAAGSVEEARRAAAGRPGELSVVEVNLPDGSGSALARELRNAGWQRTIVLATDRDPFSVVGAIAAGVSCYLTVPQADADAGRPGAVPTQRTPAPTTTSDAGDTQGLSQREIDVLQFVADGRSNREVGEELGLSALTVKSHLARIARKLGTGDRAEMVMIALRAGLLA